MILLTLPFVLLTLLTGLIFVATGLIMLRYPPKDINGLYGYRTSSSMKSKERWDFAQDYSGRLMLKYGIWLSLISLLGFLFKPGELIGTFISLAVLTVFTILLIWKTEKSIKEKFVDE